MKNTGKTKSRTIKFGWKRIIVIIIFQLCTSSLFAGIIKDGYLDNNNIFSEIENSFYYGYLNNNNITSEIEKSFYYKIESQSNNSENNQSISSSSLNWHKILGWGTIGMAALSIITSKNPDGIHCELSYAATILAATTTAQGFYQYHHTLYEKDEESNYNTLAITHASLGTISTILFTSIIIVAQQNKATNYHRNAGMLSGFTFAATVGVVYF